MSSLRIFVPFLGSVKLHGEYSLHHTLPCGPSPPKALQCVADKQTHKTFLVIFGVSVIFRVTGQSQHGGCYWMSW